VNHVSINFKLNKHSTIPLSPNMVWNNEQIHRTIIFAVIWRIYCTITYSLHYRTSTHFTLLLILLTHLPFFRLIFWTTSHFPSLHFYLLLFAALLITFLILFLKLHVLPVRAPISLSVSCLQSVMVLFTKEYLPTSVFCFLTPIFQLWSTLLR
jgi:hypothetical protein